MSNYPGYPTKKFSETQKFFILDPNTQTPSFVSGADLVNYLTPSQNYVYSESTRATAQATDYPVGALIETAGATSAGDNFAAVYLVVAAGEGDFPMDNGNELLVIKGDEFLREQLAQNTPGDGSDLVAHTGTANTVTETLDEHASDIAKRTIYVGSVAELEALSLAVGTNVYLTEAGRAGPGVIKSGTPPSDPQKGFYIVLANGNYWERTEKYPIKATWFGLDTTAPDNEIYIEASLPFLNRSHIESGVFPMSAGFELVEAQGLVGDFSAIPSTGLGSVLQFNGTGNAITIDGGFAGFDSRRFNKLSDFSVNNISGTTSTLFADFMTIFELKNLIFYAYGSTNYNMFLRSCYNGKINGGRLRGAAIANMYWTIEAADPVFSGQTLITGMDFWDAQNGTNDAAGTITETPANIMEQLIFEKCHWQNNDIGFWVKSGGDKTLIGAHFEANLQNDLRVDASADNPKILSAFVNNGVTTTQCFYIDGINGCVNNTDFIEVDNGAECIRVGPNCKNLSIEGVNIRRASGSVISGIVVEGEGTVISNIGAVTGGTSATWPVITIEAGSKNTYISNLNYTNFGAAGAVVDNGGENIVFEDAEIITSPEFQLDGGTQNFAHYTTKSGFVNRVWLVYPDGTGAGTSTALQVGRSTGAGLTDNTRYVNASTPVSAGVYTRQTATVSATPFLGAGDVLTISTPGTSTTVGSAQVIVEITPYRALS